MSKKVDILRALVNERLTAAAEEIFALVERTIVEYEEELCRSKEENQRKQQLLDSVLNQHTTQDVQPNTTSPPTKATESSTGLDEERADVHEVKREQEELCIKEEEEPDYPSVVIQVEEGKRAPTDDDDWPKTHGSTAASSARAHVAAANSAGASKDSQKTKKYVCEECGKAFGWRATWRRHVTTHSEASRYTCSVCGKRFPQKSHLVTHMVTHTGEKPFGCPQCHARFSQKQNLARHMITHSGERAFGCPACGKLFSHKHSLQLHMLTHNGEKPFSCSLCDSRFTKKPHLNRHVKCCHDGEKPYSCPLCQRSFTQKSDMQRHMKVHARNTTNVQRKDT